jgi:hypothetical protein
MKGHIFIKTNDKLGGAAERAPDNLLHTTAKKNLNKQTSSVQQSSSCRIWAGQEIANLLSNQKINYRTHNSPANGPFPRQKPDHSYPFSRINCNTIYTCASKVIFLHRVSE